MPMLDDTPFLFEIERESVEVIPLTVYSYSASAATWEATTAYTASVVAASARPSSFTTPATDNGVTGPLVSGPTLGPGQFHGFVKFDGAVQDPVRPAFRLKVR